MDGKKHGGRRPVRRKDDKRLIRKMVNPTKVTIALETDHLEELKARYGNARHRHNWQDVVRELIENHLYGTNNELSKDS